MTSAALVSSTLLLFHPAYTYSASPTWFVWVKLTCDSIHHHLRARPNFPSTLIDAQATLGHAKALLLFYLNHPIQFVQVIGIVVAIEDVYEHFFLLTVDDSSGETIDVMFWKPEPRSAAQDSQNGYGDAAGADQKPKDTAIDENNIKALLPTMQIGSCVQAKGTITEFRGRRQLSLVRLALVPTTTAELKLIDARTAFYNTVLNRPWQLSSSKLKRLREKAEGDRAEEGGRVKRARKRAQAKLDREARHEKEILRQWDGEEKERARMAERARRAGEEVMDMIARKRRKVGEVVQEDDD